jgi:hypothetical protein
VDAVQACQLDDEGDVGVVVVVRSAGDVDDYVRHSDVLGVGAVPGGEERGAFGGMDGLMDGMGWGVVGGSREMESRECFVGDEEEGETGPEITTKMR